MNLDHPYTGAASLFGFIAVAVLAGVEAITSTVDAQEVAAWALGLFGTGGLGWKVWSDRSATTRADDVFTKALAEMEKDRDFWRDRALAAEPEK